MSRSVRVALAVFGVLIAVAACSRAPYTRRVQYNVVPEPLMRSIGAVTYRSMLSESRVSNGGEDARTLRQVGRRIARASNEPEYDWEYSLIRDDTINAWCLPGGKIGFYTGILPVLKNESGMAFVMGHEVGHAIAHHGAERLTAQLTVLGGLAGLELFLSNRTQMSRAQRELVLGALGVGTQVGVLLPFSRAHESEADIIGMMYMAKAGYPPAESTRVWERMERQTGGGGPAFLSTHPSNRRRIDNLREWLPQAQKRYRRHKLDEPVREVLWGGGSGSGSRGSSGGSRPSPKPKPRPR